MAVGRQLVGAHAEHQAQRSAQRQIEPAVPAHPAGGPGHRRARPVVTVVPPLRGVGATQLAEQTASAQSELDGDLVDLGVTGRGESLHQAGVLGGRGQQVAGAEVTGPQPLLPRDPLGCQQGRRPGHKHHLADRRVVGAGMCRDNHGPLPALIARQVGQEAMCGSSGVVERRAQVLPDGVAAVFDDRRARLFDGTHQHRLQVHRPLGHRRGRAVLGGFRHAVHALNSA